MQLLLLSSSRTPAGYLTDYLGDIRPFTAEVRRAVFIPFAAVSLSWDEYAKRVEDAIGLPLYPINELADADLVVVGGGNTFQLLKQCRERGLLNPIQEKVKGGTRYLGWSAGANLACPTIKTTNDMPIVDPGSLDALGLVPFQINPHYLNVSLPGHHGETRDDRLAEFARMNPELPVFALPEGSWIRVSGQGAEMRAELRGAHAAMLFHGTKPAARVSPGPIPHKL
jgi:dipeptidase E